MNKNGMAIKIILVMILIIAVGNSYRNYAYLKQARNKINTLNATIMQNDILIVKLVKQVKTQQDLLNSVKAMLDKTAEALKTGKKPKAAKR